ncbi:biotin/lipoyl-binding protein [Hymenobacter sp. BT186]|uniref:Biotin/lipoyl-binding protein n=1 Tax=Hymenobacter telluris TaxID=2816474 RepID=A0A939EWQ0_9BACT|nr:biotin/lipoyl-binding protein [Hymenobacter telluris]MBO0357997.1 biotin/lipoyl-binding protein [Hymenobacter telluris]MBW3374024.1 biotin/lipoyl-binding protein [Hymenobacter norwichensis]
MPFKHGVFNSLVVSSAMFSLTATQSLSESSTTPALPAYTTSTTTSAPAPASADDSGTIRPITAGVKGHVLQLFFTPGQHVQAGQLLAKVSEETAGSSRYIVSFVVAPTNGVMTENHLQHGDFHHAHTVLASLRTDKP